MRVWFNGGEVPEHREVLAALGVERVAFNLAPVVNQRGGSAGDRDGLDPFQTVFYTSQADVDQDAMQTVIGSYSDSESVVLGLPSDELPIIPMWDGRDLEDLYDDAVTYGMVAIEEAHALDQKNQKPLTVFLRRNSHVRIWCVTSKTKVLAFPFITDAIVTGWLHSSKYRELQMWDGQKVLRIPRDGRIKAIEKHRSQISNLGEDPDLLIEGDMRSNVDLAIRSWMQYERVVTNLPPLESVSDMFDNPDTLASDDDEPAHRESEILPIIAPPDGKSYTDEDGEHRPRLQVRSASLRKCDVCIINQECPKFKKGASCAYEIPIIIRTKAEREAVDDLLLDIQLQRVLAEVHIEQVMSQGADAKTSKELDRYVRMREGIQRSRQEGGTVTITAQGGGGALSALFGSKVGEANLELAQPVTSDQLIEDAHVLER